MYEIRTKVVAETTKLKKTDTDTDILYSKYEWVETWRSSKQEFQYMFREWFNY